MPETKLHVDDCPFLFSRLGMEGGCPLDQVRGGCGGGRQPLVQAPRVHTIAEGMAATEAGNEGRARTGGSGGKGLCTGEGES